MPVALLAPFIFAAAAGGAVQLSDRCHGASAPPSEPGRDPDALRHAFLCGRVDGSSTPLPDEGVTRDVARRRRWDELWKAAYGDGFDAGRRAKAGATPESCRPATFRVHAYDHLPAPPQLEPTAWARTDQDAWFQGFWAGRAVLHHAVEASARREADAAFDDAWRAAWDQGFVAATEATRSRRDAT